jgi:hypothetical protein
MGGPRQFGVCICKSLINSVSGSAIRSSGREMNAPDRETAARGNAMNARPGEIVSRCDATNAGRAEKLAVTQFDWPLDARMLISIPL